MRETQLPLTVKELKVSGGEGGGHKHRLWESTLQGHREPRQGTPGLHSGVSPG